MNNSSFEHFHTCLRLIRSPGIGPVSYFDTVNKYGSEEEALDALIKMRREVSSLKDIEREIKNHENIGAHLLLYSDPRYPSLLKQIHDFPPIVSVVGRVDLLNHTSIAIVGTRAASLNGKNFTVQLAKNLGEEGYVITSGLARGIDGAAHKGSITSGTIAVVAGGIDTLYPPEHRDLREQIIENGCIISEMPLGVFPGAKHFPRRNRLISGLSKATCVIEAAYPSGSMITADYALDQGRDLFAVPGFPGDARSAGCNQLLKNGAYLLENASDVINLYGRGTLVRGIKPIGESSPFTTFATPTEHSSNLEDQLLSLLSAKPISKDMLCEELGVEPSLINTLLLNLELSERIVCDGEGQVSLKT